ncbi:MAG TPA: alpha,alpha-trehalose-phosphate synthase (UDP-forming), partial [Thermoanaerobaculia bacterium]|nr:alpha,alpha-trehalose-phosphate synthase (UDP-forming) [Thermoanaerobaculia bacterium]
MIIVSNRLPIVLQKGPAGWEVHAGSGGLVQAVAPILQEKGGVWVGWPGVSGADEGWREVAQEAVAKTGYELHPVPLSEEEVELFYLGFSNSVLWPLFHDFLDACDFDPVYWRAYREVNRKFAEAVVEASEPGDFIWVQDYQLIHVGQFVREATEDRRIGFFLHTPFPPLDIFVKLPWRASILRGLVSHDVVGFQTVRDRRNFLTCVRHLLPDVKTRGRGSLIEAILPLKGRTRTVSVASFPVGIDYQAYARAAASPEVVTRIAELRRDLGDVALVLGVDRQDYTKGIPQRLQAFRTALERYPKLRERVVFFQVSVPSREGVAEYQDLKVEIEQMVGEINGRFATVGWVPVHYYYRSLVHRTLIALYRMAEVAFVTPLKDGMNLVAKEYCACQVERDGVLILSEFAGAAAQLQSGALLVNPYDVEGVAEALERALRMPREERAERMRRMQNRLRRQDVFWWAQRYLSAAFGETLKGFQGEQEYVPRIDLEADEA